MMIDRNAAGEALDGARWQSDLARALGITDRTMRRWAIDSDMPAGVAEKIADLYEKRSAALSTLAYPLRK